MKQFRFNAAMLVATALALAATAQDTDNTAPAAPEIVAALSNVNEGAASAYGEDQWSKRLDEAFSALFEREVRVFTVASGTAANAIAVASLTPPWGAVLARW